MVEEFEYILHPLRRQSHVEVDELAKPVRLWYFFLAFLSYFVEQRLKVLLLESGGGFNTLIYLRFGQRRFQICFGNVPVVVLVDKLKYFNEVFCLILG